jgi:hypothetical protein
MDDAFARLKKQEACPKHVWGKPKHDVPTNPGMLKIYGETWNVRCRRCGRITGRRSLEQLHAEVLDV